jgi:hypothetical protein
VARLNGAISLRFVYALVARGKLRANRQLGKLLIEESSLEELIEPPQRGPPVPEMPSPQPRGRPKKKTMELW